MIIRLGKTALVGSIALFFTLVAYGNITDYGSNWVFVQHVLAMDTTFKSPNLMWRAVTDPEQQRAAYLAIIAWEGLTALFCWLGALNLLRYCAAPGAEFHRAKAVAIIGLTMGLFLYIFGFMVIAGEWFAMWQSQTYNGQASAGHFITMSGIVLIFLAQRDHDLG